MLYLSYENTVGFYLDACGLAHKCLTAPNEIHNYPQQLTLNKRSSLLGAALHKGCTLSLVLLWHPLKPITLELLPHPPPNSFLSLLGTNGTGSPGNELLPGE